MSQLRSAVEIMSRAFTAEDAVFSRTWLPTSGGPFLSEKLQNVIPVTEAHSQFWHANEEFISEMPLNIGSLRSSQLLRTTRSTNTSGLTATAKHTFGHKKEASMTQISKGFVLISALAALALSANVASAGMHMGSGGGAGKVQGFQINKQTDTASPKLYNFHNGTHIPNMTVYDKHKDW